MRTASLTTLLVIAAALSGCMHDRDRKPFLTAHALNRAAAKCHVESLGLHHSKGSTLPYGDYLIPAAEIAAGEDARQSPGCMAGALERYRYDFLGQVEHRPKD